MVFCGFRTWDMTQNVIANKSLYVNNTPLHRRTITTTRLGAALTHIMVSGNYPYTCYRTQTNTNFKYCPFEELLIVIWKLSLDYLNYPVGARVRMNNVISKMHTDVSFPAIPYISTFIWFCTICSTLIITEFLRYAYCSYEKSWWCQFNYILYIYIYWYAIPNKTQLWIDYICTP